MIVGRRPQVLDGGKYSTAVQEYEGYKDCRRVAPVGQ